MNSAISLFIWGFVQVALVSINTYQVAHRHYAPAIGVGFGISLVWSHNVHGVAFGTEWHRICYSAGAALGTVCGMWAAHRFHRKKGNRK